MNDTPVRLSPHAAFWLIFSVLAVLALLLFARILLPFAAGMVIAYLFHPVVDGLSRVGISRGFGAFAIIALGSLAVAALLILILPLIFEQVSQLIRNLPGYLQTAREYILQHYGHYLQSLERFMQSQQPANAPQSDLTQQLTQTVAPLIVSRLEALLVSSLAFFNSIALFFITPIVTFFLLRDWDKMVLELDHLLPRNDAPAIREVATEMNWTISAYLRGTLTVLILISTFYMVALGLIGLNYGLLIGLGAGLISFVPYLGSTGGFLVSGGVAAAQFSPDYTKVALVLGVFVFGQLVEGNILTPNIVGNKVRLHPVWLLFALIASSYLLGFTGLLISVPLAAAIGVLVRHFVRRYKGSEMYDDRNRLPLETTSQ